MAAAVVQASDAFRVLAHPGRMRLALALCGSEASTSDLASILGRQRAYIWRHLAVLRRLGLVDCRRAGRHTVYRLADAQLCAMLATAQLVAADLSADRPGRRR